MTTDRLIYVAIIAVGWFLSAYFAVSALDPAGALPAALFAMIIGLVVYLLLDSRGQIDRPGLPLALMLLAPIICLAVGIAWWFLRLVGLWRPLR